ncbi:ATP-binding protein [Niabella hibiscisoli]|uniref:ATP-binding protein n=1 Tax=Niabella hibiscisoli TaxID=1825928 RepID=UPI001F0EF735|nr:ATP-binding protein [Niabella hibiscisoli]MCH5719479.1 ATP-binding protein [Niabella hibiscisoli]
MKGLICFNTQTEKIKTYTKANGLITDQFNFNSAYKDQNGKMYFGTVKGMIAFQPEHLLINKEAPPVHITGIFVNYETPKSFTYADPIIMSDEQSTFSIEFASLDYASASAVQYKYMMEGFDKKWVHLATNRRAYFTDVPSGTYKFTVQAQSNLGYWVSAPVTLVITVLPPFWKSTPALAIYILVGILAILLFFYIYHKNQVKKNLRKNQLFEMQKERETYNTKMNFFANIAHEIQTPLALIKGPLEWALSRLDDVTTVKRNLELVNRNTNRLVQLTSELLDFRKMDMQQFQPKFMETDVSALLKIIVDNFESAGTSEPINLTIHLPVAPVYAQIDREAFQKIMSNLISNATKYAETSAEVNLYIDDSEPQFFKVVVINDGTPIPAESQKKIFEPFYRVPSRSTLRGTGIGLSFAKTLTEMHHGRLEYIASATNLNIFELTLPLHQETTPAKAIENETIHINNR